MKKSNKRKLNAHIRAALAEINEIEDATKRENSMQWLRLSVANQCRSRREFIRSVNTFNLKEMGIEVLVNKGNIYRKDGKWLVRKSKVVHGLNQRKTILKIA